MDSVMTRTTTRDVIGMVAIVVVCQANRSNSSGASNAHAGIAQSASLMDALHLSKLVQDVVQANIREMDFVTIITTTWHAIGMVVTVADQMQISNTAKRASVLTVILKSKAMPVSKCLKVHVARQSSKVMDFVTIITTTQLAHGTKVIVAETVVSNHNSNTAKAVNVATAPSKQLSKTHVSAKLYLNVELRNTKEMAFAMTTTTMPVAHGMVATVAV